jgi:hypothetical protein
VIGQHPAVAAAVVFGVPSPTWGEEVGVAVVLRGSTDPKASAGRGSAAAVVADLRKFALARLAARKVPVHWRVVEDSELPKTGAGKYIRMGLAERLGVSVQEFREDGGAAGESVCVCVKCRLADDESFAGWLIGLVPACCCMLRWDKLLQLHTDDCTHNIVLCSR